MSVRDTSIEAFEDNDDSGLNDTLDQRVFDYVQEHGPQSRRQIAQGMRAETATISGAVHRLVQRCLLQDGPKVRCPLSGRRVYEVRVVRAYL